MPKKFDVFFIGMIAGLLLSLGVNWLNGVEPPPQPHFYTPQPFVAMCSETPIQSITVQCFVDSASGFDVRVGR